MRSIMVKLPAAEQISIVPLADLHVGDSSCDWHLIKNRIDSIKADPNAYAILDGDLIDNGTKSSIGDIYSQTANPNQQINLIIELLQPIKNKILAACPGNHEQRTWRQDGIDITERICHELGIVDRYSPATAVLTVQIGKVSYKIHISHGAGSGRTVGAKANRLVAMSDVVEGCDVHLCGHSHVPLVTRKTIMTESKGKLQQREILYANTAACLKYGNGGYGEIQGFTPTSMVNPTIYLSGKTKFAWAVL